MSDETPKRLKVLASAYSCEPLKGSEQGIGWNFVTQIARNHDVWVLTRSNNREPIEKYLKDHPMPNVTWVYYDLPRWSYFWWKKWGMYFYYNLWQFGAYRRGKQLHQEVGFDVSHHVTFSSFWVPSYLANIKDVPFVWGPIGGAEHGNRSLYQGFRWRSRMYEWVRDFVRWITPYNPLVRGVAKRATAILATTKQSAEQLEKIRGRPVDDVLLSIGLGEDLFNSLSALPIRDSDPFRLISVGRLINWKGFHLGLEAFGRFAKDFPEAEYWIVGRGQLENQLKARAAELGVADRVHLTGAIPRAEVVQRLGDCDVLLHPALHESGGTVVAEGMAAGKSVICLDIGGPALQTVENTGFAVKADDREIAIEGMAEAMRKLASDRDLRLKMAHAAREHARHELLWDHKGEYITRLYQKTCGHQTESV